MIRGEAAKPGEPGPRSHWKVVVAGTFVAAVTVPATWYLLGLISAEPAADAAEEKALLLAHVLLPLWVALSLVVAIVVVVGTIRLVAALVPRRHQGAPPRDPRPQ